MGWLAAPNHIRVLDGGAWDDPLPFENYGLLASTGFGEYIYSVGGADEIKFYRTDPLTFVSEKFAELDGYNTPVDWLLVFAEDSFVLRFGDEKNFFVQYVPQEFEEVSIAEKIRGFQSGFDRTPYMWSDSKIFQYDGTNLTTIAELNGAFQKITAVVPHDGGFVILTDKKILRFADDAWTTLANETADRVFSSKDGALYFGRKVNPLTNRFYRLDDSKLVGIAGGMELPCPYEKIAAVGENFLLALCNYPGEFCGEGEPDDKGYQIIAEGDNLVCSKPDVIGWHLHLFDSRRAKRFEWP
ncbi:hypothetical protein K8I61_05285 [bacterium]|nr:hypothetical protein [bacterium]